MLLLVAKVMLSKYKNSKAKIYKSRTIYIKRERWESNGEKIHE
jgi:hypothetical protein